MLTNEHREKLRTLPMRLKAVLTGQDMAIDLVAERLQHGELGLTTPGRPKASFMFLGPTGVGKTELTLRFTDDLIGPGRVVRLDMSEYQTADRLALLLGTSEEAGRIAEGFDACEGRGTLLFDEIEKAHPRVLDVLLQLLDAARLTTGSHRMLDFSEWYVVLTSNIGAQRIMTMRKSKYETMERLVRQDALRELRPEIFARITVTVVFNKLGYDAQCEIAGGMIAKECAALCARGFAIAPEQQVSEIVIQRGYHERLGARPMRDATELLIRNALARELLSGGDGAGRLVPHPDGQQLQLTPAASYHAAQNGYSPCRGAESEPPLRRFDQSPYQGALARGEGGGFPKRLRCVGRDSSVRAELVHRGRERRGHGRAGTFRTVHRWTSAHSDRHESQGRTDLLSAAEHPLRWNL
jgi:ATP-dependent Clp protease ATP-binding subunit ClpA